MILILYILGGLIALVVLALVFLPAFIDEQAVINLAQEQVRQATGGELRVDGELDLNLFPELKLNLGSTTIDLPPQNAEGSRLVATIPERLSKSVGADLRIVTCPVHTSVTIGLAWTTVNHRAPLNMWVREMIYRLNARARKGG